MTSDTLIQGLIREIEASLGAMLNGRAAATACAAGDSRDRAPAWLSVLTLGGDARGTLTIWFDRAGAAACTRAALQQADDPDDAAVADLLREVVAQAAAALTLTPSCNGMTIEAAAAVLTTPGAEPTASFDLDLAGQGRCRISARADVSEPARPEDPNGLEKLQAVLDVELPLIVRFGCAVMPLKTLAGLTPGSMIDMDRSPDDPVELLVGERVIALGEVVIVSGNYGVKITELIDAGRPSTRLMEA